MSTDFGTGFVARTITTADGLRLHARDYGSDLNAALPVICLPGLTRNSRDFHQLAIFLSRHPQFPRRVIALDYRGRGLSDWDDNKANYNIAVEAQDVLMLCDALNVPRAAFIGTSRGGLILHLIAVVKPELLAGVVLNDVGPVLEPAGLRHIQDYLSQARRPENFADAAEILRGLHGRDFPALSADDWREMAQAIYRQDSSLIVSDFDPAIAEAMRAADLSKPLPDMWAQFEAMAVAPLMIVRGENSKLLSEETANKMLRRHPRAELLTASGQGHAPSLHIDGIAERLQQFIEACG
jgi:pimeloyl-ACP methyl ester carboxylesterase